METADQFVRLLAWQTKMLLEHEGFSFEHLSHAPTDEDVNTGRPSEPRLPASTHARSSEMNGVDPS